MSGVLSLIEHMDRTVAFLRTGRTSREMLNPRPSLRVPYYMRVLFYYSIFWRNLLWFALLLFLIYIKVELTSLLQLKADFDRAVTVEGDMLNMEQEKGMVFIFFS